MSYEIIYQTKVMTERHESVDGGETKFVYCIEAGSNNCYDSRNRRSRSWQVIALGSFDEVLRQMVKMSGSCEGGMLKPGGRDATPEAFIKRVRSLLNKALKDGEAGPTGGWWAPSVRVDDADEATVQVVKGLGATLVEDQWYGQRRVRADFGDDKAAFWSFVRGQSRNKYGWQFANVHGLMAS